MSDFSQLVWCRKGEFPPGLASILVTNGILVQDTANILKGRGGDGAALLAFVDPERLNQGPELWGRCVFVNLLDGSVWTTWG